MKIIERMESDEHESKNKKITHDAGRKQLGDFTPDFAHFNKDE
ncbi:hypothetical protein [Enterococcus cecorum]|nr:hypothetical protein [Enterococcus cecorum]